MKHRAAPQELDPHERALRSARRRRLMVYGIFIFGAFGFCVMTMIAPVSQLLVQQRRIDDVRRQADKVTKENGDLRGQIKTLNQDTTIERLAREELGLVKKGEEPYVLVPPGTPLGAAPDGIKASDQGGNTAPKPAGVADRGN